MTLPLLLLMAAAADAADFSGSWELILRGGQIADASRVQVSFNDGKYGFSMSGMECSGTAEGNGSGSPASRTARP
jgi:hypothetical protein